MTWKQEKLIEQLSVVQQLGNIVVVSGGLAWHIMSPPHVENKFVHDHSDIDLFALPPDAPEVFAQLKEMKFNRYWTKYATPNFYRYGKTAERDEKRVKILIDLFIEWVPFIYVNGYRVVEPEFLLSLYRTTHSSKNCTAVKSATVIVNRGESPVGRMELIGKKPSKW